MGEESKFAENRKIKGKTSKIIQKLLQIKSGNGYKE